MSTGYKIDNLAGSYYLTFQVIDWVDVFTRKIYRDIILESLDYCRINKGLVLGLGDHEQTCTLLV